MFINGQEVAATWVSGTGNEAPNVTNEPLYIGAITPSITEEFDGRIDDVKIYDYERTQAQVAWEYNQGAPVGWWRLDECSGTTAYDAATDYDGTGGNNGTITIGSSGSNTSAGTCGGSSGEAWFEGATGKRNASLDFDGTDDLVAIDNSASINSLSSIVTVSAWVKSTSDADFKTIFSTWDGTNGYNIHIRQTTGYAALWSNTGVDLVSSTPVTDGNWHHIVGVWDGTNAFVYVDGDQKISGARTFANSTKDSQIGTECSGADSTTCFNFVDGLIDDVKVWNYPLSDQQIRDEYNAGAVRFGP